jgi:hypothetical protein
LLFFDFLQLFGLADCFLDFFGLLLLLDFGLFPFDFERELFFFYFGADGLFFFSFPGLFFFSATLPFARSFPFAGLLGEGFAGSF